MQAWVAVVTKFNYPSLFYLCDDSRPDCLQANINNLGKTKH